MNTNFNSLDENYFGQEFDLWRDVKGYEGYYIVSKDGIVKRTGGSVKRGNHLLSVPERTLLPLDNGKGYLRIKLTKNNNAKRVMLHRIIAEAWVVNINNKPCVNHIDGNKKNNTIENLEWVTQIENVRHSVLIGTFHKYKKLKISGTKFQS